MSEHWSKLYVRHVIAERGITASALAKLAKVSSTTLTRPLNSPQHKHNFGRDTLDKIANATGIPYGPFQGDEPMDGEDPKAGLLHDYSALSPAGRRQAEKYVRFLLQEQIDAEDDGQPQGSQG
ncbi:XRE family transcriptional regulator [Paracoccus sp. (in: a-proteobacteria)]|uniref:helix-turn-helix domain-containing protein n=1 Tax=Paracoccus sp. TaxID=267 RepID=UPI0028A941BD|nr:XRE family transcriptional regulator [Paracoccus sp. (in: a-proteobacteria)]